MYRKERGTLLLDQLTFILRRTEHSCLNNKYRIPVRCHYRHLFLQYIESISEIKIRWGHLLKVFLYFVLHVQLFQVRNQVLWIYTEN